MRAVNGIARPGQKLAAKILIFQGLVGLLVAFFVFVLSGQQAGFYAIAGVAVAWLPGAVFSFFAFRYAGATKNQLVVRSFRKGSALKLLITIFLFAFIFKQFQADFLPLMIGYIATLIAQWPGLMIYSISE